MKYLYCPQCGIRRFQIKKTKGAGVIVNVSSEHKIVPINEEQSTEDFNHELLFCLGCSWKGRKEQLKRIPLS